MTTVTNPAPDHKAETAAPSADMTGWTGADFDSWEVLTSLSIPDPITRVTRARRACRARVQERTR
ncbi:hypothetical protein [Streptomyces tsukubensis]|uniref:hypothetical protein n=1 Tax=Streptomyces tsukubensis TaxID=83656 RepID=UPI00344B75CF